MAGESTSGKTEARTEDAILDWRDSAACADSDPSLFFPSEERASDEMVQKALGICATCQVKDECLEYALETNQPAGIWGGLEYNDRRTYRKRWLAVRRRNTAE